MPARLRMFLEFTIAPRALHVQKTRRVGLAPAHTPALRSAPRVQPRSTLPRISAQPSSVSEFTTAQSGGCRGTRGSTCQPRQHASERATSVEFLRFYWRGRGARGARAARGWWRAREADYSLGRPRQRENQKKSPPCTSKIPSSHAGRFLGSSCLNQPYTVTIIIRTA